MKRSSLVFIGLLIISTLATFQFLDTENEATVEIIRDMGNEQSNEIEEAIKNKALETMAGFSGGFIQTSDDSFTLQSTKVNLYFHPSSIAFQYTTLEENVNGAFTTNKQPDFEVMTVTLDLVGSNYVLPIVEDKTPTYVNILKGKDKDQWTVKQSFYRTLIYENIYDSIDLVYQINDKGELKYEFHVYPGGSPEDIILSYDGPLSLEKVQDGIEIKINQNQPRTIIDQNPINFVGNERNIEVTGEFVIFDKFSYGYAIDDYDRSEVLIIDPMLEFSTYTGSGYSYGMAIDNSGNVYVAGPTSYSLYPTTVGAMNETYSGGTFDMYISKLSNDGSTLIYSTFIGSSSTGYDMLRDIEVDDSGNVYFTGFTDSADFPTTEGVFNITNNGIATNIFDAVIGKLSSDGSSLIFSTYLGGGGSDYGYDLVLDASNNIYVLGGTQTNSSFPFPTTTGAYNQTHSGSIDAYVVKINSDGSAILNSTLIGGSAGDLGFKLALDNTGRVIASGYTSAGATPFPTTIGAYSDTNQGANDIFIAIFTPNLDNLVASTLFGGEKDDYARQIVVDENDNIYFPGYTSSLSLPVTANAFKNTYGGNPHDGILVKLSSDLSTLIYSTYFGGNGFDHLNSLSFDPVGNYIIVGQTASTNFPTTINTYNETTNGNTEVFIAKLNKEGNKLLFSTFFGGSLDEFGGYHLSDNAGALYISGYTTSSNFPKTENTYDGNISSSPVFIAKFSIEFTNPDLSASTSYFMEQPNNAKNITWQVGDKYPAFYYIEKNGSVEVPDTAWSNGTIGYNISSLPEGVHNLTISVVDQSGNLVSDTIIVIIDGTAPNLSPVSNITYQMSSTGNTIEWVIGDFYPHVYNVTKDGQTEVFTTVWTNTTVSVDIDGLSLGTYTYVIKVYDQAWNMAIDIVQVTVVDTTIPDISSPNDITYPGGLQSLTLQWNVGDNNPTNYDVLLNGSSILSGTWSNGTIGVDVGNLFPGLYNFTLMIYDIGGNNATDTVIVEVVDLIPPEVSSPDDIFITPFDSGITINWTIGDKYPTVYNISRDGVVITNNTSYINGSVIINIDGLPLGIHNFTIYVHDIGGQVTTDLVQVTVVWIPVVSNSGDVYISGNTSGNNITWTVLYNNSLVYNITQNGGLVITNEPWTNGTISMSIDSLLDGNYNFTIDLKDQTDYIVTDTIIVVVDSVDPIVTGVSNLTIEDNNTTVNLQWNATDANPDVYSVLLNNDIIIQNISWTNGTISVLFEELEPGEYNITIVVFDKAGNSAVDSILLIITDTISPIISGPEDQVAEQGETIYLIWDLSDLNPGTYSVIIDDVAIMENTSWQNGSLSFEIDDLSLGSHNITLVVYDGEDNVAEWSVLISIVDTTPPSISNPFDISFNEGDNNMSITWEAFDLNPSVYSVQMGRSVLVNNDTWNNGEITVILNDLEFGEYTVIITIFDLADNSVSDSVTVSINVFDETSPQISSPRDIEYIEGETNNNIRWSVSDDHPDKYQVTKDGQIFKEGMWLVGNFILSVDGLTAGSYVFKLTIFDTSGNSASDEVVVNVIAKSTPSENAFLPVSFNLVMLTLSFLIIITKSMRNKLKYNILS